MSDQPCCITGGIRWLHNRKRSEEAYHLRSTVAAYRLGRAEPLHPTNNDDVTSEDGAIDVFPKAEDPGVFASRIDSFTATDMLPIEILQSLLNS